MEQIRLLPVQKKRYEEFFELTRKNDAFLRVWLPWLDAMQTPVNSFRYLADCEHKFRHQLAYHYFLISNDAIIGTIGLRDVIDRTALVGYWLDEAHTCRGIMSQALGTLSLHAFERLNIDTLFLRCAELNAASNRVAQKAGFHRSGRINNGENLYGVLHDLIVYRLDRADVGR
ncbi:GNAT family N-acetyltransferase [Paludibacterium yongneupense]|uniref:GNAT family N-acetyltransferase n=1 Tax=Paludibacterium yongneupense TaxID=400061 RepID=UPI00048F340E|nr:GNAT family protein [Paludibacterium yongneupense]